jgi:hypothetical protein
MSGQRTQWNEATRVQMPAIVHLTRIGFTYFGKITEDKAGTVYDPDTNILIEVFKSQFAKLNPERAGEAEAIPSERRFLTVMYLIVPLPSLKLSRGFKPVRIPSIASDIFALFQLAGNSFLASLLHTICPPDERYGLPLSSGKSNCVNQ